MRRNSSVAATVMKSIRRTKKTSPRQVMTAKQGRKTTAAATRAPRPRSRRRGRGGAVASGGAVGGSAGAAEAALPALELAKGKQQILLGEIRPQHVGEVQLGVSELPEQEVAD